MAAVSIFWVFYNTTRTIDDSHTVNESRVVGSTFSVGRPVCRRVRIAHNLERAASLICLQCQFKLLVLIPGIQEQFSNGSIFPISKHFRSCRCVGAELKQSPNILQPIINNSWVAIHLRVPQSPYCNHRISITYM